MNTLLVVFCMVFTSATISALEIIQPYPENAIVLEGESLTISCTAKDTSGYPSKVIFTRRSEDFITYKEIQNSKRVYVTNTTRNDSKGLTRTSVLHINPVQPSDHYSSAPYQCWAYPAKPGQAAVEKLVFTLYVIPKSDLPRAIVRGATTTFGGPANVTCVITYTGNQYTAPLKSLAWTKNTKTIKNGSTSIDPLKIKAATSKDGGVYKCVAMVKLQTSKPVNVTLGMAILKIKIKFLAAPREVIVIKGDIVVLECPAEGYPLNVTWMRKLKDDREVSLKDASNISSVDERYVATRPCSYCRYTLTINSVQSRDAGSYVCKANEGQHQYDLFVSETIYPTTGVAEPTTAYMTDPTSISSSAAMVTVQTFLVVVALISILMSV